MKQVAAAKIRRAEAARKRARPYADALGEMLGDLISAGLVLRSSLHEAREGGAPPGIIMMSSDGSRRVNSNVIRAAEDFARPRHRAILRRRQSAQRGAAAWAPPIIHRGRWGPSRSSTPRAKWRAAPRTTSAPANPEIVLVSQKLVTMMLQRPQARKLVPILMEDLSTLQGGANRRPRPPARAVRYEFAPSPELVLSRLLPKYLEFTIYSSMLETDAAFFAAQLVAMTNATDNASNLIDELTIAMNNTRQAQLEDSSIVGGAEALGSSRDQTGASSS